ncbi:hypothetical protein HAX54_040448, partial [Datura stramonium]|nr:hypothetical protein [Datura stramonium]
MTSPVIKKQQEATAQMEIAKRQQLHDELESDNYSGSEVHYNIETFEESPVVTTRTKSKAQEAAAATASPPQSNEGSDEAESDGDNPSVDNAEEGNDDAEESGDDDTDAEEYDDKENVVEKSNKQGVNLNEKGNPIRSIRKEPKIQINALNEVPKLKRLFEGYSMYWMAKTPGKYSMEMICKFYTNYYYTLEKKAPSKNVIKKESVLDSVRVRAIPVDISERTITRILMGGDYTVPTRTTEYDYRIEEMKGIRELSNEDKSWWSIVRYRLAATVNDNVLSTDKAALVACIMSEYLLNIPWTIAIEIRERAVKENTTLLFPSLIYQVCMESRVPVFPDIDHMITNIRTVDIALIKDDLNPVTRVRVPFGGPRLSESTPRR